MTKSNLKSIHDLVHYTDEDGYEHLLPFDYVSESLKTVSHTENMIHNGKLFVAWGQITNLAADGTYDIILRTPASTTAYVHILKLEGWTDGGQCRLQIYESPTTATSDTSFTPINRNRLSNGVSGVKIETSGTVTIGAATQINQKIFGGGTIGASDLGGDTGLARASYILDTSTTYVIRSVNKAVDSSTVSIFLLWSENGKGLES